MFGGSEGMHGWNWLEAFLLRTAPISLRKQVKILGPTQGKTRKTLTVWYLRRHLLSGLWQHWGLTLRVPTGTSLNFAPHMSYFFHPSPVLWTIVVLSVWLCFTCTRCWIFPPSFILKNFRATKKVGRLLQGTLCTLLYLHELSVFSHIDYLSP